MGKLLISAGGGDGIGSDELSAAASQVLAGTNYVGADTNDDIGIGTMPNQGKKDASLNCGDSYTIPEGYHNGQGKVTANSLASQTAVQSRKTAVGVGQILTGYEAWVNGGRVIGTMANQGAKTSSLNCGDSYTIPAGYHNGSGKITANSLASQTGGVTAGDTDVRIGKTYWKDGTKRTGTMSERAAATITPGSSDQSIATNQFLSGAQTIKGDGNLKELSTKE